MLSIRSSDPMAHAAANLPEVLRLRRSQFETQGWSTELREKFGYHTPDEWYEALLMSLVDESTVWMDFGCGHDVFPSNGALARVLANKCRYLVGLDPSDNIDRNEFVHERVKCMIEDYRTDVGFDLITLRMVAEHLTKPYQVMRQLAHLLKPNGRIVIYTVHKHSPSALAASMTPMKVHHAVKRVLWEAHEEDTFPTVYKMNTRKDVRILSESLGLRPSLYAELADTRSSSRSKIVNTVELALWRGLEAVHLPYPERCILAIYQRLM